jgi:hypothetical protein
MEDLIDREVAFAVRRAVKYDECAPPDEQMQRIIEAASNAAMGVVYEVIEFDDPAQDGGRVTT